MNAEHENRNRNYIDFHHCKSSNVSLAVLLALPRRNKFGTRQLRIVNIYIQWVLSAANSIFFVDDNYVRRTYFEYHAYNKSTCFILHSMITFTCKLIEINEWKEPFLDNNFFPHQMRNMRGKINQNQNNGETISKNKNWNDSALIQGRSHSCFFQNIY